MIASISLDLDNKWSYMKTHGDAGWDKLPTYLPIVIPRVLKLLAEHNLKITWFIVGQDAALDHHRDVLRSITAAGHEVGNHSFHHEPWLHLYSRPAIVDELARTEDVIERATGVRPTGFRGPGYSVSVSTPLQILPSQARTRWRGRRVPGRRQCHRTSLGSCQSMRDYCQTRLPTDHCGTDCLFGG